MRKNQNGITLIALVVTIVVLLILAGVSINLVLGNNGIITKAKAATLETEISDISDRIAMINSSLEIDNHLNNYGEDTLGYLRKNGYIDDDHIINTKKLLGKKSKYGNGYSNEEKTNVYKIQDNKIIYIDEKGETTNQRDVKLVETPFITEWTVEANDTIYLPIACVPVGGEESDNDFKVDWGDNSSIEKVVGLPEERPSHTYTAAGTYKISISGTCKYFTFTSIEKVYPETFKKLTRIVQWGSTELSGCNFAYAINLEGTIPEPSVNTFSCIQSNGLEAIFSYCKKIDSIPENLFANISENVNTFAGAFRGCESITSIPEKLFENAGNVENFYETFVGCVSLESIPANLFKNNTKVKNFGGTFAGDSKITSVPENLFDSANNVTNFKKTFADLTNLTSAPRLWERTTEGLDGTSCYSYCHTFRSSLSSIDEQVKNTWFLDDQKSKIHQLL